MKKIIFLIISFFFSVFSFAQTEEQMEEWLHKGQVAAEKKDYNEAIHYYEMLGAGLSKQYGEDDEIYGLNCQILSSFYSLLGNYAKAVEMGTKAMEIFKILYGESHPDYALSLSYLARYYACLGNFTKAVELGTHALKIQKVTLGEENNDYSQSLNNLGGYYSSLGDYAKAVELGTKALEICKVTFGENNPQYATALNNLATYYCDLGNYTIAIELGLKALEIRKTVLGERHPDYASSLGNLASYYSELGDYAKALELGLKALEIRKTVLGERHPDYASSLSNLALNYCKIGDYCKALELSKQAMEIRREVLGESHPDYILSLNITAVCYSELGNYTVAIELGSKVLDIRKTLFGDKHPSYASSLSNLAFNYCKLGEYAKAMEMGIKAAEIRQTVLGDSHPDYAATLSNLAQYYSQLGDDYKAVELEMKALEIRKVSLGENHLDYALSLGNLACYYSKLGNNDRAVELGIKALITKKRVLGEMHPSYANSIENLANYYFYVGDYNKTIELETKALEIRKMTFGENHPDYATSLSNLANYYFYIYNLEKALETGTKAMEIRKAALGENHPYYATSLNNLACFYSDIGDYAKTLNYYRENISILQSNTLQQFTGLTSTQRTMFWAKDSYQFTDIYPSFAYLSHATTAPDLYDKSALFAKGLLLSTEIEMNRLIQESGDAEALRMFEELQVNRMQLQKLYETPIAERHINTDSLAQVVDRQEQALVKRSKVYGDFTQKLRTTWQDVQGALKDDEIAVEFLSFNVFGTDSTMVAALTLRKDDKEPKFIPLFEQRQLQEVSDQRYYHCPELTSLVWQPLQQELKGIKRIYFSPAGVLHNIGIEYAPGMENYEMYRLSTTREIITEASPGPSQGGEKVAALYGGVDYNASISGIPPSEGTGEVSIALHRSLIDSLNVRGMTANYLPATLEEVQDIKASFDKRKQAAFLTTGKDATETAVKTLSANSPKILHIATHGFYLTEDRASYARSHEKLRFLGQDDHQSAANLEDKALTRSGLLMAGANGTLHGEDRPLDMDDGILTAQEISRLDLRGLDLVVLSACKTGNGDINQGEGVFGLQRGFKKAGAQTIVMSLWEVDDKATQILMTNFYDNLLQGQSKRDAFQNAQKHLRTVEKGHYNEPQYWAAFILLD